MSREGLRFEFVMKEAPYVGFPRGVAGKRMSRVIAAPYGSSQVFYVGILVPDFTFYLAIMILKSSMFIHRAYLNFYFNRVSV